MNANLESQTLLIAELKEESRQLEAELEEAKRPHVGAIKSAMDRRKQAVHRLKMLNQTSPKFQEATETLGEAEKSCEIACLPIQHLQDAIDENDIAINQITTDMILDIKTASKSEEFESNDTPEDICGIMDTILKAAIVGTFQYIIMAKRGIIFAPDLVYEQDPLKHEVQECYEWLMKTDNDALHMPGMKYNKELKKDTFVGAFTFNYICHGLGSTPAGIQRGFNILEKRTVEEVEEALARYMNKAYRKAQEIKAAEKDELVNPLGPTDKDIDSLSDEIEQGEIV